jgi:hypothetical protein
MGACDPPGCRALCEEQGAGRQIDDQADHDGTKDAVLAQRKAWRDRAQTGPSMRSANASEEQRWIMGQHRELCAPSLTSSDASLKESFDYRPRSRGCSERNALADQ